MLEDARAEHGVDPVAGVQDEVLPHPAHGGAEQRDDHERDADDDQRVDRLVNDDLVDDDLREERGRQREQLDRRRREQHVAPDRLVLEQLGHEPAEAERRCRLGPRVGIGDRLARQRKLHDEPGEARGETFRRDRRRARATRLDQLQLGLGRTGDDRQPVCRGLRAFDRHAGEYHYAGRADRRDPVRGRLARGGLESEPAGGVEQRLEGVRRRELAQDERGVEGHALDLAHRGQREQHILFRQSDVAHLPSPTAPLARRRGKLGQSMLELPCEQGFSCVLAPYSATVPAVRMPRTRARDNYSSCRLPTTPGTRERLRLAARMDAIQPFHVMEIQRRAFELEAGGRRVVHMEIGQPDFPAPQPIVEAAIAALKREPMGYTDALGIRPLREAIAQFYADRYRLTVAPERIVVTAGASGAFLIAMGVPDRSRRRGAHARPLLPVQPPLRADVRGQREDDPRRRGRGITSSRSRTCGGIGGRGRAA